MLRVSVLDVDQLAYAYYAFIPYAYGASGIYKDRSCGFTSGGFSCSSTIESGQAVGMGARLRRFP